MEEKTTTTTYSTTTTAYVTTAPVSSPGVGLVLDLAYLRTLPGMVKCIAIVSVVCLHRLVVA